MNHAVQLKLLNPPAATGAVANLRSEKEIRVWRESENQLRRSGYLSDRMQRLITVRKSAELFTHESHPGSEQADRDRILFGRRAAGDRYVEHLAFGKGMLAVFKTDFTDCWQASAALRAPE